DIHQENLWEQNIQFHTTTEGVRKIERYIPELNSKGVQDLPPEKLRRCAFKMATGSGKTWVMAMAIVWSYFHKKMISTSNLSTNFLIVAPNVIVYQRLEKDFASNRLFHEIPLIPPAWCSQFSLRVVLRDHVSEPDPSGNLFLTNIQQLYEFREQEWTPKNAVEALLGKKPAQDLASSGQRSMLERLKSLKDLVVINDEAHHVHDSELAWSRSLLSMNKSIHGGLSLWLDFSATPKDQNGMYFPWTVVDYPLAQAVEDRIVKAPLIVTKEEDAEQPDQDPENVTGNTVVEKYGYWLRAAVSRWKEHWKVYEDLQEKPVLFIVVEKSIYADAIGEYLRTTPELGFDESEILVIHTDTTGEIRANDLEIARKAARDIDKVNNKIKVIVSVMMLREGWDVRNVTVVLGLRPFTARAEILPEQVIGRGLRLMTNIGPDRIQTLEVLGTRNLLKTLQTQLEVEGVGVVAAKNDPPQPVKIYPLKERNAYDITIPITKPSLTHNLCILSNFSIDSLKPLYDQQEINVDYRIRLRAEFAHVRTEVHRINIDPEQSFPQQFLSSITTKLISYARLPSKFAEIYPIVRDYVITQCFGAPIDINDEKIRSHLSRLEMQEGVARYLARELSNVTVERREIEFERAEFRLSKTIPFTWRRNLQPSPLVARKTIFNYVATYNDYEREFAVFLDSAPDVEKFAALGTTEQGSSGCRFRVDYIKQSGAIGFYYPDWVAVQRTDQGLINWIIETKGRVWEDTIAKDHAIKEWCNRITKERKENWRFKRVNQREFNNKGASITLEELVNE
ncbi:MAG TPA: DEAD/DEAH box helicase family protein, partial [Mesotoga infera]|nr:DEAD/DEAH box helicase family protein [Mesotoga infera]